MLIPTVAFAENWVWYKKDNNGYDVYFDKDYCKEITIDGYDVWKIREKIDKGKTYTIWLEFYNVDLKKMKLLYIEEYDSITNKLMYRDDIGDENWYRIGQESQDKFNTIINMMKEANKPAII